MVKIFVLQDISFPGANPDESLGSGGWQDGSSNLLLILQFLPAGRPMWQRQDAKKSVAARRVVFFLRKNKIKVGVSSYGIIRFELRFVSVILMCAEDKWKLACR